MLNSTNLKEIKGYFFQTERRGTGVQPQEGCNNKLKSLKNA